MNIRVSPIQTPITLDFEKDAVFLNGDNPVSETGIKLYIEKIKKQEQISPVELIKIRKTKNNIKDLNVSCLIPINNIDSDIIHIIANGHHRTVAYSKTGNILPAIIIWEKY